jgi:cytochrome c-type biogenesis protein CcmH
MTRSAGSRVRPSVAAWLVLAAVTVGALVFGTLADNEPVTPADRVLSLTKSIRCPQCLGQSVAESDVTVSREIRRDIARRVEEGQTDAEIRAYYASSFGEDALLSPPSSGLGGLVWVLPVAVLVAGAAGLALALRRWSADRGHEASEDDRALVAEALASRGRRADPASTGADRTGGVPPGRDEDNSGGR